MSRATLHLVEGPVGAGKSTYALALAERDGMPWLCLDACFAQLFIPDRPPAAGLDWYLERKARVEAYLWDVARSLLEAGNSVILELGLLTADKRRIFYEQVSDAGFTCCLHVVEAPVDVRRERVRLRNFEQGPTWHVDITDEMFERANGWWEPPADDEYDLVTIVQPAVSRIPQP